MKIDIDEPHSNYKNVGAYYRISQNF